MNVWEDEMCLKFWDFILCSNSTNLYIQKIAECYTRDNKMQSVDDRNSGDDRIQFWRKKV
jgi:hypothetical protein